MTLRVYIAGSIGPGFSPFLFSSFNFTNAGATGREGPTLAQLTADPGYQAQNWTQDPRYLNDGSASGGGGSYVFLPSGSLLAAAGGGGGANCYNIGGPISGQSASLTINGTAGYPSGGAGGVNGGGGGANAPATPGSPGLGGNGGDISDGPGGGGGSFGTPLSTYLGGLGSPAACLIGASDGGFGGGGSSGSPGCSAPGGGGGGGFSGGGGGARYSATAPKAGGGGGTGAPYGITMSKLHPKTRHKGP
ncbi:hypothetical protein WJX75_006122 [Coccomyxa subellipsoidea]|uniref:PE-PGRS family protein n=1 Tax=Coccomyxa subellipsoidea TaxID=248742 RepID=A0ABR2YYB9_9CHLO